MAKTKKHTGTKSQMDSHAHDILEVLHSIDRHLASMVYHQDPKTGGFAPALEKAVGETFMSTTNEGRAHSLQTIIRQEIRNVLGEQLNGNHFRNR